MKKYFIIKDIEEEILLFKELKHRIISFRHFDFFHSYNSSVNVPPGEGQFCERIAVRYCVPQRAVFLAEIAPEKFVKYCFN